MYRVFFVGERPFYLNDLNFTITVLPDTNEALENIGEFNPHLIVLSGEIEESDLLNFCHNIREKHSLILPILIVLEFYCFINLEQFRSLGVDFIIKPFTKEEFREKLESLLFRTKKAALAIQESDLFDKFKPYIRQEVKSEIQNIIKQILEDLEHRYV